MVNKQVLSSFISKYYLNGLNNKVKWRIKDKSLTVYAGSAGKVCKVVLKNIDLEDGELGIFDTNKLNKILSITYGDLIVSFEKQKSIFTKLNISDQNYNLTYSLADILIIESVPYYKDRDDYSITLTLDKNNMQSLIKAKNALLDVDNMLITTTPDLDGEMICEFIFGDNTGFSNKITYQMLGDIKEEIIPLPFNSDIFKDILNSNKDMDYGVLKISPLGIIKFTFFSEELETEYYLARNE